MVRPRPILSLIAAACILALSTAFLLPAAAQDADGDGLPDAAEEQLGTDPNFAEQLDLIAEDPAGESKEADNYHPGLDITALYFGNIAEDRYLFRVDFLEDYHAQNSTFILYVNADNDPKTGRKDEGAMGGTDYMVRPDGIAIIDAEGSYTYGLSCSTVVDGKLYLCADLPLNQVDGKSVFRAKLLSESRDPYKGVDNTAWLDIVGQGQSDRKKVVRIADTTESENFDVTWGLDTQRAIRKDDRNVVFTIQECEMEGFEEDIFTEYHMPSAKLTGMPARVTATVPGPGFYYPAFIVYDQDGNQVLSLSIDGERKGIAAASEDNNRQALFVLSDPVMLAGGEKMTVELHSGNFTRLEDLFLLAEKPEIRPPLREIRHVKGEAVFPLDGSAPTGRITWVTTWPAACTLEYGPTANFGSTLAEETPLANHRLIIPELDEGATCHFRITANTPEGETLTETRSFKVEQPRPAGKVERAELKLTLRNVPDAGLSGWPVTQGLPFPEGHLASADNLRLLDAAGNEVPLQVTPLNRWPDGSIRWALLDFQADAPRAQEPAYTLEYGTAVSRAAPANAIQVEEAADGLVVATGPMRVELLKSGGLLGHILLSDKLISEGSFAELVGPEGKRYDSLNEVEQLTVELPGPLRTVVHVKGSFRAEDGSELFAYETRLHFYAGQPFMRVFFTLGNDNTVQNFTTIESLSLRLPLAAEGDPSCAFGAEDTIERTVAGAAWVLDQDFDDHYAVIAGDRIRSEGERAAGWVDLQGDAAGATVSVRNFWQLYPKSLAADEEGITVGICPAFPDDRYDQEAFRDFEDRLFFYLMGSGYKLKRGVSKTHELLFDFRLATEGRGDALDRAAALQSAPVLLTSPEWYCDSKAFGDILKPSPELGGLYADYEESARRAMDGYLQRRRDLREYGMLNFGDWWGERGRNWGNIEYDTQHAFYLHALRSGDLDFFYRGQEAARHNRDVDTIWYSDDPNRIGCVYAHCIGHTGDYYTHKINDQGSPRGGFSVSHTWVEGYLDDYLVGGDRRSLECAEIVAGHYDGAYLSNYDFNNCRTPGWHLILTLAMYRETLDPYYLNAAHIIMDRVKERETEGGGWRRQLMPGHCHCLPRCRGSAAFMVGVHLSGMKDYHQATGDQETADMIVRGAHNVIDECWVPEKHGMRYTSCPKSSCGSSLSLLIAEGIAYGYKLSGDKDLGDVMLTGTQAAVAGFGGMGKGFSQQLRWAPHVLYHLHELTGKDFGLLPGGTHTVLLEEDDDRPFELTLRPTSGPGQASARLTAADGSKLASLKLSGARATVVEVPADKRWGVHRLELDITAGAWDLECGLGRGIVRAQDTPLRSDPFRPQYFFTVPCGERRVAVGLRALGQGEYQARMLDGSGKVVAERTFRGGERTCHLVEHANLAKSQTWSFVVEGGPFEVTLEGVPPFVAAWPSHLFNPGRPAAHIYVRGDLGPAGSSVVAFNGSRSSDADGRVTRYLWRFPDGTEAEGPRVKHDFAEPGDYEIELTVTDDEGLTDTVEATLTVPPRWVLDLDPGRARAVEAEDFSAQGGGEVQVFDRIGDVGKMITMWHANVGHWLEWTVNLPAEGRYHVILKYATGSENTRRDLMIDGEYAHEALREFHLPSTGGFCTQRNNWRYCRLEDEEGRPIALNLTAGEHTIRMSNLGDGCALDRIILAPAE